MDEKKQVIAIRSSTGEKSAIITPHAGMPI
jgi:hypothetical protein